MKVPELRRRILFTLAMIVVVRLGVQIPLPGIDVMELQKVIEASANASGPGAGLATVLTIFSGGGLQQCGIFALGIMPYISASIMTQLLSAVVPQWAKMVREEGGRQKMTKWTRAIAIVIALCRAGSWSARWNTRNACRPWVSTFPRTASLSLTPASSSPS